MRNMPKRTALLAALLIVAAASADTVVLNDGRRFVGKVTKADGKVRIETAMGPVTVFEAQVMIITPEDAPAPPDTPGTGPEAVDAPPPGPQWQWDPEAVTFPEPLLYMTIRQIELLPPEAVDAGIRARRRQWQGYSHERQRKYGMMWLDRDQRERRREAFAERAKEAGDALHKAARARPDDWAERAQQQRLVAQAREALIRTAKTWPDQLIAEFLVAGQELDAGEYMAAERRFLWCIQAEPLVAAFHQGRGMALLGLKNPLKALEEFRTCLKRRDDTFQTLEMLKSALLEVPGHSLRHPGFLAARALLDRYEAPDRPYRPSTRGTLWLMPGREWASRDGELPTPPYERLICRTALGVPISEDVLVADSDALNGALEVYVQATPSDVVRATPPRSSSSRDAEEVPLTMIRVHGAKLTPVDLEKAAPLAARQRLTIRAANAYRQMGTTVRQGEVTVASAEAGDVKLNGTGILPGERVGAAFAGEQFAGFLTARMDPRADNAGTSRFVDPKVLADWAAKAKKSLERTSSSRGRGPVLKEDAARVEAPGKVFLVYILCGEKPLPKALN